MNTAGIKNLKAARKYSNAIFEAAVEADLCEKVLSQLEQIVETFNSGKDLYDFILSPIIKNTDKKEVIQKIFGNNTEKIILDFLFLLIDKNRINTINEVLDIYKEKYNQINNIIKPVIISAVELNDEQKNNITEKIKSRLSKTIIPEYKTDEEIIGGLIIEIGDKTVDCSLKTKFENIRKQLVKGNRYGSN